MSKKNKDVKVKPQICDERYFVIRKEFFTIMHDGSQAFDKAIVSLSIAILGFIFGLILYRQQVIGYPVLLIAGSLFFVLAISFSLYSLWLRQDYAVKGVAHLNKEYDSKTSFYEPFNDPVIEEMEKAKKMSGIFFIIALIMMLLFVGWNI